MKISLKIFILYVAKRVTADIITFMFFRFGRKNPSKYSMRQSVDLSSYSEMIADYDDRSDFNNAVEAAKVGSLRLAYIGIWIAVIESLKRRVMHRKEDSNIDHDKLNDDKGIIKEAEKLRIVAKCDEQIFHIMLARRNLYAHATSCEPNEENIISAAADAVKILLNKSKSLNLDKEEEEILVCLLGNYPSWKNDKDYVEKFLEKALSQLNEDHYTDFLEYYWIELEKNYYRWRKEKDNDIKIIHRRGIWFSQALLLKATEIVDRIDWKRKISQYENILSEICLITEIFMRICEEAQNEVIDNLTKHSKNSLNYDNDEIRSGLQQLYDSDILLASQREKLEKYFIELEELEKQILNFDRALSYQEQDNYNNLISFLKIRDWDEQQKAIDWISRSGPSAINNYDKLQKINLGRNILQAAEGSSFAARDLIELIRINANIWSIDLIHGIAIECFANEYREIRLKTKEITRVIRILDQFEEKKQFKKNITEIAETIQNGMAKKTAEFSQLHEVVEMLGSRDWAKKISDALRNRTIDLLKPF